MKWYTEHAIGGNGEVLPDVGDAWPRAASKKKPVEVAEGERPGPKKVYATIDGAKFPLFDDPVGHIIK